MSVSPSSSHTLVAKSCPTLATLSGSAVHEILQARMLECVAISFAIGAPYHKMKGLSL